MAVFARSSAHSIGSIDDAVRRFRAYEQSGVDALFIPGIKKREDLDAIAAAVKLPIVAAGVGEKAADAQYLASCGARIYSTGHEPFAAAVQAMYETMKAIRDGTPGKQLKGIASAELMAKLTHSADYEAFTRDYLGG